MYKPEWLKYTIEQRQKLAEHFGMKKTMPTEVFNNTVVSDGYSDEAIYKVSIKEADLLLGLTKKTDEKRKPTKRKESIEKGDKGTDKSKSSDKKA